MIKLSPVILLLFIALSCGKQQIQESEVNSSIYINTKVNVPESQPQISLVDSLRLVCRANTTNVFDIKTLQTDDFSVMAPIHKNLFQALFPERDDYYPGAFFIYSYLPIPGDNLSLVTYQKNYEGENYRVDYMELVTLNSEGQHLEQIRLAAQDNMVITYEVVTNLKEDTLFVTELVSTEIIANKDTLFTNQLIFKINGSSTMDTLGIESFMTERSM